LNTTVEDEVKDGKENSKSNTQTDNEQTVIDSLLLGGPSDFSHFGNGAGEVVFDCSKHTKILFKKQPWG
jgi:hypothetical protein